MTEAADRSFSLEISKAFVGKFLIALVGFGGTIAFARILGPAAFGGFYLLFALVKVADRPIAGVSTALSKRFAESGSHRSELVGIALLAWVSVLVISALGVWILAERLVAYTGVKNAPLLFLLLLGSTSLFFPFQAMVTATGRLSVSIWLDLLRSLFTTPIQLALVLFELGPAGMAIGLVTATLLTVPPTYHYLSTRPSLPTLPTLRDVWSFARFSTLSGTIGMAYKRFDALVLGFIFMPGVVGKFEVVFKLTVPAVFLSEVISDGLMARTSNLASRGKEVRTDITNALSFASLLAIPLFFGALALRESLIVTIYGPSYTDTVALLVATALYQLLRSQSAPLGRAMQGLDRPGEEFKVVTLALVINTVVGISLAYTVGPVGVVIGSVIAEGIRVLGYYRALSAAIPSIGYPFRPLLEQCGAGTTMFIVTIVTRRMVRVASWIDLAALVCLGAAVYGLSLLAISRQLRVTVKGVLQDAGVITPVETPED